MLPNRTLRTMPNTVAEHADRPRTRLPAPPPPSSMPPAEDMDALEEDAQEEDLTEAVVEEDDSADAQEVAEQIALDGCRSWLYLCFPYTAGRSE
jgi:hypothetical protein